MSTMPDMNSARSRELATLAILTLGLGLVGIDRFLISTLFPAIARDLHLGYGDIGTITGALAIAWGIAALFMGNLSDHIGRRRVLVGALLAFSLMIGASGLASGLLGLVLVRLIMGFADGAYVPASISATIEASPPERHGRNVGIQQMMLPLLGLGVAPLLVTALLRVIEWRWIFVVFALPGLLVTWLTWRALAGGSPPASAAVRSPLRDWRTVLGYRNVRILMICMLCWLSCIVVSSALLPSYLLDYLKLSNGQMGTIMSAIGFGSAVGTLVLPWLSDSIGRRPVMLVGTLGAGASLAWLSSLGAESIGALFWTLFAVHFFNNALITLTVGPLCTETVPPAMMATASGVIIAVGELLGGGLGPIAAGQVAERFGIEHILWLPLGCLAMGFVLCLFLRETNPIARAADALKSPS
jgi:predicted MFS family arabinose efflux permease